MTCEQTDSDNLCVLPEKLLDSLTRGILGAGAILYSYLKENDEEQWSRSKNPWKSLGLTCPDEGCPEGRCKFINGRYLENRRSNRPVDYP